MAQLRLVDDTTGEVLDVVVDAASFDDFWLLYPRHVAKLEAKKAWAHMTEASRAAAIVGAAAWRPVFMRKEPEYIPHPASWLRGERWEDELPVTAPAHASHVDVTPAKEYQKTSMPEHVKALLAKLRGKP